MKEITLKDKTFELYIKEQDISTCVKKCAEKMNSYYKNYNEPIVFVSILNGAAFFTVDLLKELDFVCECEFVKFCSYQNSLSSSGVVKEMIGFKNPLEGRNVVIIDDIVDTGITMKYLKDLVIKMNPKSLSTAAFIVKPKSLIVDIEVDFCALEMLDSPFIVGYGLDYQELGRNLRDIYILK